MLGHCIEEAASGGDLPVFNPEVNRFGDSETAAALESLSMATPW